MNSIIVHSLTNFFGFTCLIVYASRLYILQCFQHPHLFQIVNSQQQIQFNDTNGRLSIKDVQGNTLAIQELVYDCYIDKYTEIDRIGAKCFSLPFQKSSQTLKESFIAKNVSDFEIKQLNKLHLYNPIQNLKRTYPYRSIYSAVLGYVNKENKGQAGIEMTLDKRLAINSTFLPCWVDGRGVPTGKDLYHPFIFSKKPSFFLTLNSKLQEKLYQILKKGFTTFSPKRLGSVIMDVKTGQIKAWVEFPSYDPNNYSQYSLEKLTSWMATDYYEPGSTWKPINIAIALETACLDQKKLILDKGKVSFDHHTIKNAFCTINNQILNITDVLRFSSNVGMVKILQKIPILIYYDWLLKLDLGQKNSTNSNISYPFTTAYLNSSEFLFKSQLDFISHSIGQGIGLTVLKLIQIVNSLGNNGFLVTPTVVHSFPLHEKNLYKIFLGPAPYSLDYHLPKKKVFSNETTKTVCKMLEKTVLFGTGHNAFLQGYSVGGKTGTAQQATKNLGYQDVATSFFCFYPAQNPKYIIYIIIDKPRYPYNFASNTAVELGKTVLQEIIGLENDLPTKPRTFLFKNSKVKKNTF